MRNKRAAMIGVLVLMAAGEGQVCADQDAERLLVLHVTDYAQVSPSDMEATQRLVTGLFASAGVSADWADGAAGAAEPDSALRVDVILLSAEMVARKCLIEGTADMTFGTAVPQSRRAYLFHNRIADHAARTNAAVSRLLGALIAHEIGHILLPTERHTAFGLMRLMWEGRIVRVPGFSARQARGIRARLAAEEGPTVGVSSTEKADSAR